MKNKYTKRISHDNYTNKNNGLIGSKQLLMWLNAKYTNLSSYEIITEA